MWSSSCWPSMHVFLSFEPCFVAPMNGSMHTFLSFEACLYLLHWMELHKEGFSWILQRSVLPGLESWRNCNTYTLQPWTSHGTSEFSIECLGLGRRVTYPGIGCVEPIPVLNPDVVDYSGMFNLATHISHTWSGVNGIALVNQIQILIFWLNKIKIVIDGKGAHAWDVVRRSLCGCKSSKP